MQPATPPISSAARQQPSITVFFCANCARTAETPELRNRQRSTTPKLDWPFTMHEVAVPCVGRLQPEHLLKAFEAGSDAAVVIGCASDNCHYHEGSRRCQRRVEYVAHLLDEIGLGSERLIFGQLAGSARQDLALGEGRSPGETTFDAADTLAKLDALRALVAERLRSLPPDPMHRTIFPETTDSELDDQDEGDD
jgi:coenzyme F420-reducing hydrogenase delta subunit